MSDFLSELLHITISICIWDCSTMTAKEFHSESDCRALVSVGAVGAAAPIDRFSKRLILHPQILRKDDFYNLDFHDFHSKVTLLSVFFEHFRKSALKVLNT